MSIFIFLYFFCIFFVFLKHVFFVFLEVPHIPLVFFLYSWERSKLLLIYGNSTWIPTLHCRNCAIKKRHLVILLLKGIGGKAYDSK